MPMQTFGPDGGGQIGSPHWAVGRAEAQQKKDNPGVVNEKKLADNSQANVTLALREGPEAKKDFNQKIRNLPDTPEASKPERIDEARERRDAAVSMQQASAKELQGGGGTGGKSGSKDDDAKTAAACIEAFRKVMMAQMRREAIQKYGKDYKKTAAAAQAKKDAGEKALQDAKKELESGKKLTPKRRAELEQQKKDGLSQKIAGATELRDAKCLNTQVRSLCGASNIEPDNRGCNPPNPLPLPMLTGVQGCNPPKPSGNP